MTYDDLTELLSDSDPEHWLFDDAKGVYTLRSDLSVRIEREEVEDDFHREFHEPWANKHPDPNAYRVRYNVFYGASFVEQVLLVGVDGARAELPIPKSRDELVITATQYNFAQIINREGRLDDYLRRSGIEVER